jgi:hypothetical protein
MQITKSKFVLAADGVQLNNGVTSPWTHLTWIMLDLGGNMERNSSTIPSAMQEIFFSENTCHLGQSSLNGIAYLRCFLKWGNVWDRE